MGWRVRIGAEVKEGDILVGKVTPKGERRSAEDVLHISSGDKSVKLRRCAIVYHTIADGVCS